MWNQTFKKLKPAYVDDCRNLIILFGQCNNFAYASFKSVWSDMKFTYIHDAKAEDVEEDDFMQEMYRIFIEFLFIQGQPSYVRVGAVFGLYTLYNTKKGEKVKIKIDDTVMLELQKISQEFITLNANDAFFCLRELRVVQKAFTYTALMYTPGPPYTLPDEDVTATVPSEWLASNGVATAVDFLEIQRIRDTYEKAKSLSIQQAHEVGAKHCPIEDLHSVDELYQSVAAEIVRHEQYLMSMSSHGLTDPMAIVEHRMKLRAQAMSVTTRPTMRSKHDDDDDDTLGGMGLSSEVPSGDAENTGFEGVDRPTPEGEEERQLTTAELMQRRRKPVIPVQRKPQMRRGRKSQYLMDFELSSPMMMMPGGGVGVTPQMMGLPMDATPEQQMAMLQQMDPAIYQQYQQQAAMAAAMAQGAVVTQQQVEMAPAPGAPQEEQGKGSQPPMSSTMESSQAMSGMDLDDDALFGDETEQSASA